MAAGHRSRPKGHIFVADSGNHTVRRISSDGVVATLAGVAGQKGSADGVGAEARFNRPVGIAVGATGHVYVTDCNNHTIRCISASGNVVTLAGVAGQMGFADGLGPAVRFFNPAGIAINAAGAIYCVTFNSNTVRRIY